MNPQTTQPPQIIPFVSIRFKLPADHRIFGAFPPGQVANLELMGASILEDFKRFKIAVQISHRTGTLEDGTILLAVADPARVVDEVKPFLKTCDMLEFVTIHIVEIEAVVRNRQVFPES